MKTRPHVARACSSAARLLAIVGCVVATVGVAFAQEPLRPLAAVRSGAPAQGLAGARPGTERWIVHFVERSFDLGAFRAAVAARRPAAEVAAIVRDLEQRVRDDQRDFTAAVAALGGTVVAQWWLVNAAAVELPPARLAELRALPNLAFVEPDETRGPAILVATNASNHAADALQALGHVGAGVAVGVVDTGQDEDLGGSGRPHRTYFPGGDPLNPSGGGIGGSRLLVNRALGTMPADDVHGHGTGVASVCAGGNWGTPGADDGHAPGSGIAGYSIANTPNGLTDMTTMANAWQALAADRVAFGIAVANMSYHAWPDPLNVASQALDSCALNADVLCCAAAGNTGSSTFSSCSCANGLAVAALDANVHTVASFSARGPLLGDPQRLYPDIAACGVATVMARAGNEGIDYVDSGTSMAAPQVAGAAAQLRARFPALTALDTKAVLLASAPDLAAQNPGLGHNAFGVGLLRNDRAHALVGAGRHGAAVLPTASAQHTFTVPVQAGGSYQIAIAWHRHDTSSIAWANLDLEVLDQGGLVIAASTTPRNLYEVVRFYAPFTGVATVRTTATALGGAVPQPFAWAWHDAAPVAVAGLATPFGAGCAPVCTSLNLGGGTLVPITQPCEFAYELPATGGTVLTGFDVFTASTIGSSTTVVCAVHAHAGGTIAPTHLAATSFEVGPTPGFYRATFPTPVNVPPGPFWISLDHRLLATSLSNVGTGVVAGGFERPTLLNGPWTASSLQLRPAFRVHCDSAASGGRPRLAVAGTPRIGASFALELAHAPANGAALLALGYSNVVAPFGPLPLSLEPLGAWGCALLTSSDAVLTFPTDGAGLASATVVVPAAPALVALHLFAQWAALATAANALGLTLSNGVDVRLGS